MKDRRKILRRNREKFDHEIHRRKRQLIEQKKTYSYNVRGRERLDSKEKIAVQEGLLKIKTRRM